MLQTVCSKQKIVRNCTKKTENTLLKVRQGFGSFSSVVWPIVPPLLQRCC